MKDETINGLKKLFEAYNSVKLTTQEKLSIVKELRSKGYKYAEICEVTKINKGQISQMLNDKPAIKSFNFYEWIDKGFSNIKDENVPLTAKYKMYIEVLILKLTRIRNKK